MNQSNENRLPQRLHALLGRLRPRRHDDLGREQGQAAIRVVITTAVLAYLCFRQYPANFYPWPPDWFFFILGYIGVSLIFLVLARRSSSASLWRRTAANVGDVVTISYVLITVGEAGIPAFVLYLWITLGNGFRFGLYAMSVSAALSLIGFSAVLMFSTVWEELSTVAVAVMASLILLPAYSAHLLRHRFENTSGSKISFRNDTSLAVSGSHAIARERGQALTRLIVCTVVFVYLLIQHHPVQSFQPWLLFCLGFLGVSALFVVLLRVKPKDSTVRRTISNIADTSAISYLMVATGEAGLPLFMLYLWVTLGNGFRFGLSAMMVSATLSIVGFSVAVVASNLFQAQPTLVASILVGLMLIPGYAAHLIRQLHDARRRAEEASAAKSNFLARMSHELRTPLNGIFGTAELLAVSKRLTREDRSMLDIIKHSVRVSMRQIENVLDFSKIEAGKLIIEEIEFDLHELLNRATRVVRSIALEKNVRLTLRVDPAIPYRLVGDPHHVHEVLLNLLSNAIKFTEKGYVSIEVHLISKDKDSVSIRFEVHDTGIGIEPEAVERIFEAFSQADTGTTRRYGGTGLGTTIAKQLVELMGGRLAVNSIKGQGSTFYAEICFPYRPLAADEKVLLGGVRALLISKNADLHSRINTSLRQWGVSLTLAASVDEAVGLLARSIRLSNPFHVVLADSRAVLTVSGAHCADDFLQKTALSFTPVFLICDVSPEQVWLRHSGYAGTVPSHVPADSLFSILHASAACDEDIERGLVRVEPWAWGQSARSRMRILIADDNQINLMILKKILETANYAVDTADDGEQALDKLLRNRYKLAILDMHMPGFDGLTVVRQYRVLNSGARTPIVMLTANATVDAKMESAEAGADAYLTKPATSASVLSTIKRILDEAEVYDLDRNRRLAPAAQEVPLLDTSVLTELDRLYSDPNGMSSVLNTFESDGRRLLDSLVVAVNNKNHAIFCDLIHALKGNSASVGACRLSQACHEIQGCSVIDFRRDGEQMLHRLESEFLLATKALREFTTSGSSGTARGDPLN